MHVQKVEMTLDLQSFFTIAQRGQYIFSFVLSTIARGLELYLNIEVNL